MVRQHLVSPEQTGETEFQNQRWINEQTDFSRSVSGSSREVLLRKAMRRCSSPVLLPFVILHTAPVASQSLLEHFVQEMLKEGGFTKTTSLSSPSSSNIEHYSRSIFRGRFAGHLA